MKFNTISQSTETPRTGTTYQAGDYLYGFFAQRAARLKRVYPGNKISLPKSGFYGECEMIGGIKFLEDMPIKSCGHILTFNSNSCVNDLNPANLINEL